MTDKVHGGVAGGEFLTGKMDFFAFETDVWMAATGVVTPVKDLYQTTDAVWTPVVVNGVSYDTKADYIVAWKKQANLNILMGVFAQRANPVIVSVGAGAEFDWAVSIATEKTGLWFVNDGMGNYGDVVAADDTNYTGFKLEDAFAGVSFWKNADTDAPSDSLVWAGGSKNAKVARRVSL